ncbi:hypothetical protein XNC1_3836 [Xenorhabdus nematophila ATCC 19061]|uniref:Uncharacterized protein n=1 Tax=Xenorhabdus nematophila (strain ATCC 19061 / DSM 3370 / CCUG 14189 / LMG 1036 / NCIMB 9965 / AN6) TaxID=406817 RepID=D3VBM8_XENNA|nr:hypothetical protein XNC1_3836 [Xenorhabdus nematophila ATCC 19061]CEE90606.1 hypothetical protein XNA1_1650003 [Xenorhabdus nematophila str. Anatoliense]CEF28824.1 hypothetical protein XNW1_1410003 [Xenorhabdus nematophila str. Websteri]CEK24684.1 hypothetical protein XNC2_3690 [Xenorhabdus nematophila AN6/1]CEE93499.1 hypothetical protein XNA1_3880003 [Xenorhabdus nematophila str. Anatoliense]
MKILNQKLYWKGIFQSNVAHYANNLDKSFTFLAKCSKNTKSIHSKGILKE